MGGNVEKNISVHPCKTRITIGHINFYRYHKPQFVNHRFQIHMKTLREMGFIFIPKILKSYKLWAFDWTIKQTACDPLVKCVHYCNQIMIYNIVEKVNVILFIFVWFYIS